MTRRAVVLGAGGGLGRALAEALVARGWEEVHALSRRGAPVPGAAEGRADVTDEASLAAAARAVGGPVDQVWVAAGVLQGVHARPERRLEEVTPEGLLEAFTVNAAGPALAAKHFTPLLPRDRRGAFLALSARVGSIGDNRLGGWWSYRASKAALNMMVRCLAVELARSRPDAVCAALHPGTVDTALSRPFQRGVAPGRLLTPEGSADRLLAVADRLTPADSGGFFAYDGAPVPF